MGLDLDNAVDQLTSAGQTENGLQQLARVGFETVGSPTYPPAGLEILDGDQVSEDVSNESFASLLSVTCEMVSIRFGRMGACIPATALLVAAARELGQLLRPQPVSIWSGDETGQSATGRRALEYALGLGARVRNNTVADNAQDWFREVGHLIAVSDDHLLILDSTVGQFHRPGTNRLNVVMRVPSLILSSDESWCLQEGTWHVRYWPVDHPDGWKVEYDEAQRLIVPRYLPAVLKAVEDRVNI